MRNYSFQFEVEKLVTMFISAMDDIVVKRYNVHKSARDQIRVRFVYAPKQRVLHDLLNRAQNLQLPVAAVTIGGITRDTERVFNKIEGSTFQIKDETGHGRLLQPVPVDLTLNLSFLTRYQSDMDQCLSNFIPYCDPYFVISWRVPDMPDHEIRSQVLWSGTINYTYPTELNSTNVARYQTDTTFTLKGWLFKSFPKGDKTILTITSTITDNTTTDTSNNSLLELYMFDKLDKQIATSKTTLSAVPQPLYVDTWAMQTSATKQITLFGHSFFDVRNIYLSGEPYKDIMSTQTPFLTSTTLSAYYPGFVGVQLTPEQYTQIGENVVTITAPSAAFPGYFDIIVENKGGYGTLTQWVRKNTYNPHQPGTIDYINYIPYNPPYINGIRVVELLTERLFSSIAGRQLVAINGNLLVGI